MWLPNHNVDCNRRWRRPGQSSCIECNPGEAVNELAAWNCKECPVGREGLWLCQVCGKLLPETTRHGDGLESRDICWSWVIFPFVSSFPLIEFGVLGSNPDTSSSLPGGFSSHGLAGCAPQDLTPISTLVEIQRKKYARICVRKCEHMPEVLSKTNPNTCQTTCQSV